MSIREALEVVEMIQFILESEGQRSRSLPLGGLRQSVESLRKILVGSEQGHEGINGQSSNLKPDLEQEFSYSTPNEIEVQSPRREVTNHSEEGDYLSRERVAEARSRRFASKGKPSPGEMRGRVRELVDLIGEDSMEQELID